MPLFEQLSIGRLNRVYRTLDSIGIDSLDCQQTSTAAVPLVKEGIVKIEQDYTHEHNTLGTPTATLFMRITRAKCIVPKAVLESRHVQNDVSGLQDLMKVKFELHANC